MGDVMDGTYIFCLSDPRLYLLRLLRVHRELVLVLLPLPSRQRKENASSSTRTSAHRQRRAKKLNIMRANTYEYHACGGLKTTLEIAAPEPGTYTDTPRPECEDTNRKCTHKRVFKRHRAKEFSALIQLRKIVSPSLSLRPFMSRCISVPPATA